MQRGLFFAGSSNLRRGGPICSGIDATSVGRRVIDPELVLSASCMRVVAAAKAYCASEADRKNGRCGMPLSFVAFGDGSVRPACARGRRPIRMRAARRKPGPS